MYCTCTWSIPTPPLLPPPPPPPPIPINGTKWRKLKIEKLPFYRVYDFKIVLVEDNMKIHFHKYIPCTCI